MNSPNETRAPRKVRTFKNFEIDELSLVDIPAQQPALLAIRKADDKKGEQLSDRIKDPSLSDEEKKKLAAKLNPNYGKSALGFLARSVITAGNWNQRLARAQTLDRSIKANTAELVALKNSGVRSPMMADIPRLGRELRTAHDKVKAAQGNKALSEPEKEIIAQNYINRLDEMENHLAEALEEATGAAMRLGKSFVDPAVEDLLGDYETARQAFNHPTRHPLKPRQRLGVLAAGMVARRAADELVPGFKQGRRALRTGRKLRDAFLDVTGPQSTGPKVVMPPRYGKSALGVIGGAAHRAIRGTRAFAARLRKPAPEPEPMMAPPSAWQGTIKPLEPIRANPAERVPLPKAGDLGSHLRQAGRVAISAAALRQRIFNLSRDAQTLVRAGGGDQRQIRNLQTRLRSLRIAEGGQTGPTPLSDKLAAQYPQFFSVVGKSFTKAESDLFDLIRGHERQAELYQNIKADMLAEGRVPSRVIDEAIATAEKHKRELLAGLRDAETALVNARGRQTTRSKLRTLGRAASGLDYDAPGDTRNVRPLSAVWNKLRSSGKFDFIGDDAKGGIPKDLHGFGPVRRVLRGAQFLQGVSRWSRRKGTADAVEEFGPSISRRKLRMFGATALGGAAGKTLEMVGAPRGTAVAGMAAGFAGQGAREIGRIVSRYRELIARNQRYIDEAKRLKVGKSFGKAQDINATAREVDRLIKGLEQRLDRARQAGDQSAIRQLRGRINEAKRIRRAILSDHARYGTVLDEAVRAGGPEKWARKKQAEAGRKADAAARAVIESGGTPEEAKVLQGEIITAAEQEVQEKAQAVVRYRENKRAVMKLGALAGGAAVGAWAWRASRDLPEKNPAKKLGQRVAAAVGGAIAGAVGGAFAGKTGYELLADDPDKQRKARRLGVVDPGGPARLVGVTGRSSAPVGVFQDPVEGRTYRRVKHFWSKGPRFLVAGRLGRLAGAGKRIGIVGPARKPTGRKGRGAAPVKTSAVERTGSLMSQRWAESAKMRNVTSDEISRWQQKLLRPGLTEPERKLIVSTFNRHFGLTGKDVISQPPASPAWRPAPQA